MCLRVRICVCVYVYDLFMCCFASALVNVMEREGGGKRRKERER